MTTWHSKHMPHSEVVEDQRLAVASKSVIVATRPAIARLVVVQLATQ